VRHGLNGDLGFSEKERREVRDAVKALFPEGAFKEIHVQCDLEVCKQRDPKGLYKKAAAGEIKDFTGVSAPYEKPMTPDLTIDSVELQPVEAVRVIRQKLL
jgi:adenylylsulfate kinase-like enzyme